MKKIIPSFIILGTSLICLASCNIKKASNSSNNITNSTTSNITTNPNIPASSANTTNSNNSTAKPTSTTSDSSSSSTSSSTTLKPSSTSTNTTTSTSKPTSSPNSSTSKPTSSPSSSTSNTSSPSSTSIEYNLDLTKITTAVDTAKLTTETLNNSFLTVINSNYVTARYNTKKNENYCIENKNANLKVTFKGTGTITIGYSSTGNTNNSRIRLVNSNGEYITATSYSGYTYISNESSYEIVGTTKKDITFNITSPGDYFIDCVSASTNRGGRIYSIKMTDTYNSSTPSSTTKPTSTSTPTFTTSSSSNTTSTPSIDIPDSDKTEIEIIEANDYGNSCYGIFSPIINHENSSDYTISYKKANTSDYITLDKELLRKENNNFRYDIVGLTKGEYTIRIQAKNTVYKEYTTFISEYDKSGYAHFNYNSGIGAYNNDGSLKENSIVLYVTEENKNTISIVYNNKTYTGIVNILVNAKNINVPIDVRFIGKVSAATWNELINKAYTEATTSTIKGANGKYLSLKGYSQEEIISNGFNTLNETSYSKLNGLTNKVLYDSSKKEFDSYYNMCDISEAKNLTLEGIGNDSEIFQWGFEFKKCNSIEVRNLIFTDYTEDAIGFEGSKSDITSSGNYWIHNCEFNVGKNYWDVCSEQDKHDGDGSTDIKYCHNITISYCVYNATHKTNLIGANQDSLQYNITLHHNYYNQASQRLPLVRQTNLHSYNNYFLGNKNSLSGISVRSNSYSVIENCYFENMKNPIELRDDRDNDSYRGYAVKAIGNYFINCNVFSKTNSGKIQNGIMENNTTDRKALFTNTCKADGKTDMSSFDINTSLFYYDSINNKSKVDNMLESTDVKAFVLKYAGLCSGKIINYYS